MVQAGIGPLYHLQSRFQYHSLLIYNATVNSNKSLQYYNSELYLNSIVEPSLPPWSIVTSDAQLWTYKVT